MGDALVMVSVGLSTPAKLLVGAASGCLGEVGVMGKPPPGLPVLPSLPSSLRLVQPLCPQLCTSEPVFVLQSSR